MYMHLLVLFLIISHHCMVMNHLKMLNSNLVKYYDIFGF